MECTVYHKFFYSLVLKVHLSGMNLLFNPAQ